MSVSYILAGYLLQVESSIPGPAFNSMCERQIYTAEQEQSIYAILIKSKVPGARFRKYNK